MPPEISVCIPTHNRAELLPALFAGFERLGDGVPFEVIIVNDGSSDRTAVVLDELAPNAHFPLQRFDLPNRGRGAALNRAFDAARGRFIFIMDDDDMLPPNAFADALAAWNSIPEAERDAFCGICGLCVRPDGAVVGQRYANDVEDSDFFTMAMVRNVRGDKREVVLRSAIGSYRFPAMGEEKRVSTNLLWFHLAARYKARFVNVPLLIKTYRPEGITANGLRQRVASASLTRHYYSEALRQFPRAPLRTRLRLAASYFRFSRHAGASSAGSLRDMPGSRAGGAMLPVGWIIAAFDRRKLRQRE